MVVRGETRNRNRARDGQRENPERDPCLWPREGSNISSRTHSMSPRAEEKTRNRAHAWNGWVFWMDALDLRSVLVHDAECISSLVSAA